MNPHCVAPIIAPRDAFKCTKPIALAGQASITDCGEAVRIYKKIMNFSAK